MHQAVVGVAGEIQRVPEPVAEGGFRVGVVGAVQVQGDEQGEQPVGAEGEGEAPVGGGQQGGVEQHQQVLQQPVRAAQRRAGGPQPDEQEQDDDQAQLEAGTHAGVPSGAGPPSV
ncbi:hypothetical protein D3C78_1557520 [compost metagenome]